jgi:hypothetical protein
MPQFATYMEYNPLVTPDSHNTQAQATAISCTLATEQKV